MEKLRMAVIGVGNMGSVHARAIPGIDGCRLAAVCDTDVAKADALAAQLGAKAFYDAESLLEERCCDAVLIATPHYDHTTIGIAALKKGYHVLVEKPISVHKNDCKRLLAAHTDSTQVFAAMFNQRTDPHYRRVKDIIDNGELGELKRIVWIITDWFRSQAYYDNGGWRATWAGEGGGVLLNQCPHNLDLLQWLGGLPSRIHAFCHIAKHHTIEVEDDVTAFLEYPNGATGVFIASTGDAPGTNRLEITGERGKIIVENGSVHWSYNEIPVTQFCRTTDQAFAKPPLREITIPVEGSGGQHGEIVRNFVAAIRAEEPLIAPASEGIHSVEIANAMLYSSITGKQVTLPLDADAYEQQLRRLVEESSFIKKTRSNVSVAMEASFR